MAKWKCRCGAVYAMDVVECPLCKRPGSGYPSRAEIAKREIVASDDVAKPEVEFGVYAATSSVVTKLAEIVMPTK